MTNFEAIQYVLDHSDFPADVQEKLTKIQASYGARKKSPKEMAKAQEAATRREEIAAIIRSAGTDGIKASDIVPRLSYPTSVQSVASLITRMEVKPIKTVIKGKTYYHFEEA